MIIITHVICVKYAYLVVLCYQKAKTISAIFANKIELGLIDKEDVLVGYIG